MLHSWRRLDRVSRFPCGSWIMRRITGLKSEMKWGRTNLCGPLVSANNFFCTNGMDRAGMSGATKEDTVSHPADDADEPDLLPANCRHRDGSLYKRKRGFLKEYRIADRYETLLEPMTLSEPTNCKPNLQRCRVHFPSRMMQIFSIKLAKIPDECSSIQLYGYIAVRDELDSLLNYIVNHSRDDPIIVQQGSLIEMTGPKRGISLSCDVLAEFDMRIKKGEREEDDLQLIDGIESYSELRTSEKPFTRRFDGGCGAVDVTSSIVYMAVEATIEVAISEVHSGFNLSLSSFVFINESHEEIALFHGNIGEPCGLRRCVVAVVMDTWLHLMFKVCENGSKNDVEHHCSFRANIHGSASQEIMLDLTSISVKVTWSILPS